MAEKLTKEEEEFEKRYNQIHDMITLSEETYLALRGIADHFHFMLPVQNGDSVLEQSPFMMMGDEFQYKNDVFEVRAAPYEDSFEHTWYFKYGDVEIRWGENYRKNPVINKGISDEKAKEMYRECVASIKRVGSENSPQNGTKN